MRGLAAALVLAGALAAAAMAATGDTRVVVQARGMGSIGGEADALNPSISGDGRYVAVESDSPRLHPDDRDSLYDVFVVDTASGEVTLVSRATGAKGIKGDEGSGGPAISADGRIVAFDGARDIGAPEGYRYGILYVRDLQAATTRVISRASGANGALANGSSDDPQISGDGRIAVFSSEATNLDRADRGTREDVYARDLRRNRTILVSRASGRRGRRGDHLSENPSVSRTGRYVAFESRARNLNPEDTDSGREIYVRDLVKHRTTLVFSGKGVATEPVISADGRFVAFTYAKARDIDRADTDRKPDVYVKDLHTGTIELVSHTRFDAGEPAISGDGRRIAFTAQATDLDPADTDAGFDVYLHDRTTKTTRLVSRASGDGPKAAGDDDTFSSDPVLSADGRWLGFLSSAVNLDPQDTDAGIDLFLRDLGPLDARSGD